MLTPATLLAPHVWVHLHLQKAFMRNCLEESIPNKRQRFKGCQSRGLRPLVSSTSKYAQILVSGSICFVDTCLSTLTFDVSHEFGRNPAVSRHFCLAAELLSHYSSKLQLLEPFLYAGFRSLSQSFPALYVFLTGPTEIPFSTPFTALATPMFPVVKIKIALIRPFRICGASGCADFLHL